MHLTKQYMVDFCLPALLDEHFIDNIPSQRAIVNKLFLDGKLVAYALSLETSRMWAVFNAETEQEVERLIRRLPLSPMMQYQIAPLNFCNMVQPMLREFSLN